MTDYTFSSVYVRTIEKWLLDETDIQRMVGAKDAKEALRVLEDTNYAKEFKGLILKIDPKDYRKILKEDLRVAKKLLYCLVDDKNLIKLCLLSFDFHNLKLFFKEKLFGISLSEFVSSHGSQDPKELKKEVFEKRGKIDEEFKKAIKRANEAFEKKKEPFFIDTFLDKEKFKISLILAKKLKSDWIIDFFKRKIDLLNLANIIRLYHLKKIEKIKDVLIEGGKINWDLKVLAKCGDIKDVIFSFKKEFDLKVQKILNNFLEDKNLWKLMKKLKDLQTEYLKTSKFIISGPEVILAYFLGRETANRNVRIIMEGKLYGLAPKEIQERVRIPF